MSEGRGKAAYCPICHSAYLKTLTALTRFSCAEALIVTTALVKRENHPFFAAICFKRVNFKL